jgi:cold shock CspA family protein
MSDEYFYIKGQHMKRSGKPSRPDPPGGRPTKGRITNILRGQSHGFIRATDGREVFFHRGDAEEGAFNDLAVGHAVSFELVEDAVSGPRAMRVTRNGKAGR